MIRRLRPTVTATADAADATHAVTRSADADLAQPCGASTASAVTANVGSTVSAREVIDRVRAWPRPPFERAAPATLRQSFFLPEVAEVG